jgi:hypothetical protein
VKQQPGFEPFDLPICCGKSRESYIRVLIAGPFRDSDRPIAER